MLVVNRMTAEPGAEVVLDRVLLVGGAEGTKVGSPVVTGAKVSCKVLRHAKGRKIHAFHYKPKKNIFRHYGHRQATTVLSVSSIAEG